MAFPIYRSGSGFDVHKFAQDRELWLCGVRIDHTLGLAGHSDADVAIHALCDALLGAAALRDIGFHFPDNASEYEGIDSKILLSKVAEMLSKEGYAIVNADITIICETPRISPYVERMRSVLADILSLEVSAVSVKGTTTEHLGFTGRGEGIAAISSVMIYRLP